MKWNFLFLLLLPLFATSQIDFDQREFLSKEWLLNKEHVDRVMKLDFVLEMNSLWDWHPWGYDHSAYQITGFEFFIVAKRFPVQLKSKSDWVYPKMKEELKNAKYIIVKITLKRLKDGKHVAMNEFMINFESDELSFPEAPGE